jgi:hypothetical protein
MTNEEFYKEKIYDAIAESIAVSEDGKIAICKQITCENCIFRKKQRTVSCITQMAEWLKQEYVEQVDWSKVKVDTPIYVRDNENSPWLPRHFARYENGKVYVWYGGSTSFTENEDFSCNYAKLAESEE